MDTRRLSLRGTLQRPSSGADSAGQPETDFDDVATIFVDTLVQRGIERIRAGADSSSTPVSLRMRARSGMTSDWRFVAANGTVYQFRSVPPLMSRDAYMDVVAEVVQ
jgi:SPP1 family predicted phage head-tail adaptor